MQVSPSNVSRLILILVIVEAAGLPAAAKVSVPAVFGSHMVLERDVPIPVWGWAAAGEEVTVRLDGREDRTKADADGG